MKKWQSFGFIVSFLMMTVVFAAPRDEAYPVLSIVPDNTKSITVINAKTVSVPYAVINNRSYRVNEISIGLDYHSSSDILKISYSNNTCVGVLNAYSRCSFTLTLEGKNQTGSASMAPTVCIFGGRFCSVPDNSNIVAVSTKVLKSMAITSSTSTVTANAPQQFTAMGTFADNTTGDITKNVTWHSSKPSVVTIGGSTGLATPVAAGDSIITATLDEVSSNAVTLTVPADASSISTNTQNTNQSF